MIKIKIILLAFILLFGVSCAPKYIKNSNDKLIYTCTTNPCVERVDKNYIVFNTRNDNEYDLYDVASDKIERKKKLEK